MVYTPNLFTVTIKGLFSYDDCSHFVKNLTFTNTCDSLSSPSNKICCEDLILDLFGDMKVDKCYTDSNFQNYTHMQFECLSSNIESKHFENYVGFLLLLTVIFFIIYGIMRCTEDSKPKEITPEQDSYRLARLNTGFNIQSGKYQTFEDHES